MTKIKDIYRFISKQTIINKRETNLNVLTAKNIARHLSIQRNTASHYLNQLVKNGQCIKIVGRPVIFLDKVSIEHKYHINLKSKYSSFNLLKEDLRRIKNYSVFDRLIGSKGSLSDKIEQLKAVAAYPDVGLPIILSGPTGVGKSYLAKIYFKYCLSKGLINSEGKFVHVNCAEYADNPELLSSILFGYVKGSFTGAENDKAGLFDEADKGMLFLDEVHRLSSKGQEKLFSYLDRGEISSLGSNINRKVKVRLIMATTENLQSNFLQTFLRRIPIHIEIPSLINRPKYELEDLISFFYKKESIKVNKEIIIKSSVKHALMHYNYKNNIGDLQNFITISVAKALINLTALQTNIVIDLNCLPIQLQLRELNQSNNPIGTQSDLIINSSTNIYELSSHYLIQKKIEYILKKIVTLCNKISLNKLEIYKSINDLIETLLSDGMADINSEKHLFIKNGIEVAISEINDQFHIDFFGNFTTELSKYFYLRSFYNFSMNDSNNIPNQIFTSIFKGDELKGKLLILLIMMLKNTLNYNVDNFDKLILCKYLEDSVISNEKAYIHGMIITHGNSLATNMSEVVNQIVGKSVIDAIDMPLNVHAKEIGKKLSNFINDHKFLQGLILLVDMGSLIEINKQITSRIDFPIAIITNVSTPLALKVAECIIREDNMETILYKTKQSATIQISLTYPEKVKKKLVLTCCETGQGTANKVKELLEESLPLDLKVVILAYDEKQLENPVIRSMVTNKYDCLAIVGTLNPKIDNIPFIPLESLITGEGFDRFNDILIPNNKELENKLGANIIRNFTIERIVGMLTILDAPTIIHSIDSFIDKYEKITHNSVNNTKKIALYVHLSGLVERLVRNEAISDYPNFSTILKNHSSQLNQIQHSVSVIENLYSVQIPMTEIAYIYDLLTDTL